MSLPPVTLDDPNHLGTNQYIIPNLNLWDVIQLFESQAVDTTAELFRRSETATFSISVLKIIREESAGYVCGSAGVAVRLSTALVGKQTMRFFLGWNLWFSVHRSKGKSIESGQQESLQVRLRKFYRSHLFTQWTSQTGTIEKHQHKHEPPVFQTFQTLQTPVFIQFRNFYCQKKIRVTSPLPVHSLR